MIELRNLSIGYSKNPILRNINLTLQEGKVTAIIGRNGIGKSTLLKTILGYLKPIKGSVEIEGKKISDIKRKELAKKIGVVTTEPDMASGLLLYEFVGLGRTPYTGRWGTLTKEDDIKINDSLRKLGIESKSQSFMGQLSDGERQKGMIARALVQDTPLIIMDEPFSFIDLSARLELCQFIGEIAREERKTILYTTHEVSLALRTADNIWLFPGTANGITAKEGIFSGTPDEIIERGTVNLLFPDTSVKFDKHIKDFII